MSNSLRDYFLRVADKHGIDFADPDGAFIDGHALHAEELPRRVELPTCWGPVLVVRETAKALLVEGAEGATWVPRSAVRGLAKLGDKGELEVDAWWSPTWRQVNGAKP